MNTTSRTGRFVSTLAAAAITLTALQAVTGLFGTAPAIQTAKMQLSAKTIVAAVR